MTLISSVYGVSWIKLWKEPCSRGSPCTMTGPVWPLSTLYVKSLALRNGRMCGGNLGALGSIVEGSLVWFSLSYSGDWVICNSFDTLGFRLKGKFQTCKFCHHLVTFWTCMAFFLLWKNKQSYFEEQWSPNIGVWT